MTVLLEGTTRRYIGLSTDEKPSVGLQIDGHTVGANDLPVGSSFLETDTGRIYRWNGNAWTVPALESDDQLFVLQAILIEVTQLREMVALVSGA